MMRRILAAATLLVLLAGPPVLLALLGFTDVAAIHVWSASDVRPLLLGLTVAGWLAWAWWAVAVAIELAALLRGVRPALRLPGFGVPRALAAGLLAAAFASAAPLAHASPAAPAAPPVVVVQAPRVIEPVAPTEAVPQGLRHTVAPGDDLWTLAERYYGEGTRWRSIVAANPALAQDPLAPLVTGSTLAIPDPVRLVTVQRGDTLSGLALTHLGDGHRWPEIHALNPGRIADPDEIDVGWVLRLPWSESAEAPASSPLDDASDADPGGDRDQAPSAGAGPSEQVLPPRAGMPSGLGAPAPGGAGSAPVGAEATPPPAAPNQTAPSNQTPQAGESAEAADDRADAAPIGPAAALVGGVTALSAAAIVGGIGVQRHLQRHARPLGRRFVQPGEELARFEAALHRVGAAAEPGPGRDQLLDRAQRLLGAAWREPDARAAALASATVDEQGVAFTFADAPDRAPGGFVRIGTALVAAWEDLRGATAPDAPAAFPALVTLGRDAAGAHLMLDALASGVLGVACPADQGRREVLSALLIELACAPWADDLEVCAVTGDPDFADAVAAARVRAEPDAAAALARIEAQAAERAAAADDRPWRDRRLDPDLGPAWAPQVTVFERPLTAAELGRLRAALDGSDLGMAAIVGVPASSGPADWELVWTPPPGRGDLGTPPSRDPGLLADAPLVADADPADVPGHRIAAAGLSAEPQTVTDDTRAAVTGLFALATATATEPAPWWPQEGNDMDIVSIRPTAPAPNDPAPVSGPRLHLLGPIDLTGCAGEPPARAARQCVEYCAWLHLHPGASPQQMGRSLLVAEGTRRSNMSRLRTWLGAGPAGTPYLPDAYSGRIWLADDVSSDWGDLLVLTAGGVNALPLERLLAALRLVRGAPLADAAPGQWGWAEEVRADAGALIRDIGVVAARRALAAGDTDTARWAASRALVAAPDDEVLMVERIRTEHRAGRTEDVHRLVQRVTRTARALGLDLLPETVDACQEVLEGRIRARG